ncbi:MAG: hypothetical protein CVU77_08040 [Elusimicrobia bacterium HGW-Elusimicrobia-1]|jgi:hypothetical protein|nr:MAG: hypothetical protein CVU77_08040 [Elusimicrobia bacterium HGW-Elusimicrobia-1]
MAKKVASKKAVAKEVKPLSPARGVKSPKAAAKIKKAAKPRVSPVKHQISIDHPSHGDSISRSYYAIRISCSASGHAELSINGGPWMSCREAVGFRWFDWNPAESGEHVLAARLLDDSGAVVCESSVIVCEAE